MRRAMVAVAVLLAAAVVGYDTAGAQVGGTSAVLAPWSATSPLPAPRSRNGAVFANGFMYLLGGIDSVTTVGTSFFAPVNADGTFGAWAATTPLPGPRRTVRPAAANGFMYFVGGNDGTNFRSEVYFAAINANGTLGAWTPTSPLPAPQTSHSTLAANGFLYVVGGNLGDTCTNAVRVAPLNANGTVGAWTATTPLPQPRCGNVEAVTVANGFIYAAGGFNNSDVTNQLYYARLNADGSIGPWQTSPNTLIRAREYNGLEAMNGYLYVIAGQDSLSGPPTTSVEWAPLNADGSVGPFTAGTALPAARGELATEVVNGVVYAIGGGTGQSGANPQTTTFFTRATNDQPPTVAVTSPAAGATVAGPVTVTATAADDGAVAGVQFFVDGAALGGEVAAAPYAAAWDTTIVPNGPHTLTARARDNVGNLTTSAPVVVNVGNVVSLAPVIAYALDDAAGPTAVDSSPSANAATLDAATWGPGRYGTGLQLDGTGRARSNADLTLNPTFTIEGWLLNPQATGYETLVSVGSTRDLYLAGGMLSFWSGAADLSFGVPVPAGVWTHVALTSDGTSLRAYLNGVQAGPTLPATLAPLTARVQLGAWIAGSGNGDFLSGTLDEVRLYNRPLSAAEIAVDAATPILAVDTTAPTAALTAPAAGSTLAGTVAVTADAADNVGVAGVQLLLDGALLGAEDTTAPYGASWDTTTTADGPHTLAARARDAAGNTTTSAEVAVTVDNTVVIPPVASPAVLSYGFNEGAGTTAADSSPSANAAAITDGGWGPGRAGSAIQLPGGTSRARSTAPVALGASFTLEAWVLNPTVDGYETIVTVGSNRDLYLAFGGLAFWTGAADLPFGVALPVNAWTHVAVTYDGTTLRAYVNGVQAPLTYAVALAATSAPLQVGAWISGPDNGDWLTGSIDDVRVYNRALTAAEIAADAAAPA